MADLPVLKNAYVLVEDGIIAGYGPMSDWNSKPLPKQLLDASGKMVLPCWCDSHTHLVFAGSREQEFEMKIRGASYDEIARAGGGILNSARLLQQTSEDELFRQAWDRLQEIQQFGTGAVEIKSGYGLTLESELKMLRVIRRLKQQSRMAIKATFLGAHAFPPEYRDNQEGYIRLIIDDMLPAVAREGLADYIDAFCEEGFFSPEQTGRILAAGKRYGLKAKLHANQLHRSGGVQTGVAHGALSVDHLECMGEEEIHCLQGSDTIATMLPSAAFFLRLPYPPARRMLDAGLPLAIATDYNPGSSPSGNMPLLVALSCIQMRMTPAEAINAATLNGAYAMEVADQLGSITLGKRAHLIITQAMPSLAYWPYRFGNNLIDRVLLDGEES